MAAPGHAPADESLRHHGDLDALAGLVDLAVNVRAGTPPPWLVDRLAAVDLARYPDPAPAVRAVAARHGRPLDEVLITAGATEAFVLLARAVRPRHAVVVHPQFTEPELALRAAGHDVDRIVLGAPFTFDPRLVPEGADLVVVGNPTNPTSVLHPAAALRELTRPGRLVVVDEAFADCSETELESLAGQGDVPGLVVVRSLTKTWGLAGLRVGYVLAEPAVIAALARAQPQWAVSAPAITACTAVCEPRALDEARQWARRLRDERDHAVELLSAVRGIRVVAGPQASFLLLGTERPALWDPLRDKGFAVRRGDTFPGLGPHWLRVAVRDRATSTALAAALRELS